MSQADLGELEWPSGPSGMEGPSGAWWVCPSPAWQVLLGGCGLGCYEGGLTGLTLLGHGY